MCLAVLCPKGTEKESDFLFSGIRTASRTNKDGMGFAFKRSSTKKVYISKGYDDVEKLLEAIRNKKLGSNDELIVHLRIGNKGDVNEDMCHPFVCNKETEVVLSNNAYVEDPVFIHNGTLFKYSEHNSPYSDTFFFAKNFMSHKLIQEFLIKDIELFKEYFKDHISTSRFAFLFPGVSTDAIILGDYTEDQGYFFSNGTYKSYAVRNIGGIDHYDTEYDYDYGYGYPSYGGSYNKHVELERAKEKRNRLKEERLNNQQVLDNLLSRESKAIKNKEILFPSDLYDRILSLSKDPEIVRNENGVNYVYYMGLWIPETATKFTDDDISIDVNGLNYNHIVMNATVNEHSGKILKDKSYYLTSYEWGSTTIKELCLHIIEPMAINMISPSKDQHPIYQENVIKWFTVTNKVSYANFYHDYLKLVSKVEISKNKIKRLVKLLNSKTSQEIYYEGIKYFNREVLQLFLYNMYRELFPDDYLDKFFNTTYEQKIGV